GADLRLCATSAAFAFPPAPRETPKGFNGVEHLPAGLLANDRAQPGRQEAHLPPQPGIHRVARAGSTFEDLTGGRLPCLWPCRDEHTRRFRWHLARKARGEGSSGYTLGAGSM